MKARIEKKVCKKLVEAAPKLFKDAWQECHKEPSELAYKQGSCVSGLWCVGGGVDYWGEGQDAYTALEFMESNYEWIGDFPTYPESHEFAHYPNTDGFKPTARNLINLARVYG
jgi:hypothetical protein